MKGIYVDQTQTNPTRKIYHLAVQTLSYLDSATKLAGKSATVRKDALYKSIGELQALGDQVFLMLKTMGFIQIHEYYITRTEKQSPWGSKLDASHTNGESNVIKENKTIQKAAWVSPTKAESAFINNQYLILLHASNSDRIMVSESNLSTARDLVKGGLLNKNNQNVFSITKDGKDMTAMFFSTSPKSLGVFVGDSADLIFNLDVNDWMGRRSVQLIVKDIRTSENQTVKNDGERDRFARIWAGEPFSSAEDILPDRNDFAAVYRMILASSRAGINTLSHREICAKASSVSEHRKIGYIKLKIIIKVLTELNVIGIEERDEVYTFRLYYNSGKADLEKSSLLRRLRAQQKSGTASDR